jgi:sugar phosphate isomerase/epimerase
VWAYSTLGHGHDARFWSDFVATLHSVGYDGVLSIEHEDALMNPDEAVAESVRLLRKSVQQAAPREPRRISRAR